ncbi:hypothetical protein ABT369_38895 [Dactylosporangium sp. NPDC000244]|uniref:hypothetical protein n=1 Tax=Dactylosporangium sp. NPDC000244 TaxID=3154365 RepID=UPI003333D2F7
MCPKIAKAMGTQAIYDDTASMLAIGEQAATSADSLIALKGQALADKAKAAKAKSDDVTASIEMGTAATNLATVCAQSGFKN